MKHTTSGEHSHDSKTKHQRGEHELKTIVRDAGEKIGELATGFEDEASEYIESAKDYVKRKPLKSLTIALGVGAVTGGLLGLLRARRR